MTDSTLPSPLIASDVDLRKYDYIPLDFRRLFASDTWVLGSYEERVACIYLWCESWHQVPAGSLPNDDRMLAHLSQTGQRWKRLRPHALRGWLLCSDGRFYHRVVVEKAVDAWQARMAAVEKGLAGAKKRWGTSNPSATGELSLEDSNRSKVNRSKVKTQAFVLPPWVSQAAWDAFEEMRKAIKKPMTERAKALIVTELAKISGPAGENAAAILEQSTRNNWQDVYALKGRTGKQAEIESRNSAVASSFTRRDEA